MAVEREAIHPSRYRYWIAGGAVVVLLLALVFAPYGYKEFKLWRAESLAEEALGLWEASLPAEARERASAAYMLAPENIVVLRTLALILSDMEDPSALSLWIKLDEMSALREDEDRRIYARIALRHGRANLALQIMRPLMERENPKSEDLLFAQEVAVKSGLRGYVKQTEMLLEESEGVGSAEVRLRNAQSLLAMGSKDDVATALEMLQDLRGDETGVGLRALIMIASGALFDRESRLEALEEMVSREDISVELYLQAQAVKIQLDPDKRDEVINVVCDRLLMENVESLVLLGRWLNQLHAKEKVLEIISYDAALSRKDLFGIRMDALAELNKWDRIHEILLEDNRVPISDFHRQLYLFRAHMEMGNISDAAFRWESALLPGDEQVKRLKYAGSYAARLKYYDFSQRAYERLTANPATAIDGYIALLSMYRSRDDAHGIIELLEQAQEEFPHEKAVQNDLNYYRVLLEQDVASSLTSIRELYDSDPKMMAYRMHFAFALIFLGHAEKSEMLLDIDGLDWTHLQNQWKYIKCLSLLANGHLEEAEAFLVHVDLDQLLSEERALIEDIRSSYSLE